MFPFLLCSVLAAETLQHYKKGVDAVDADDDAGSRPSNLGSTRGAPVPVCRVAPASSCVWHMAWGVLTGGPDSAVAWRQTGSARMRRSGATKHDAWTVDDVIMVFASWRVGCIVKDYREKLKCWGGPALTCGSGAKSISLLY
jgi:hypothetical protein